MSEFEWDGESLVDEGKKKKKNSIKSMLMAKTKYVYEKSWYYSSR